MVFIELNKLTSIQTITDKLFAYLIRDRKASFNSNISFSVTASFGFFLRLVDVYKNTLMLLPERFEEK